LAFVPETINWEPGIYQLEPADPVMAGLDGIANLQARQLASRTLYLNDQINQLWASSQGKLNRTIGVNDNATGTTVTDTGGDLTGAYAIPLYTIIANPSASNTQAAGNTNLSLRSISQTFADNINHLFTNKAGLNAPAFTGRPSLASALSGWNDVIAADNAPADNAANRTLITVASLARTRNAINSDRMALAGGTFTGSVTMGAGATISLVAKNGAVSYNPAAGGSDVFPATERQVAATAVNLQTSINLKANIASPTFTGVASVDTPSIIFL